MGEPEEKARLAVRAVQAFTLERMLLAALVIVLAFNAYEAHQTNLRSEENNRILKERDFSRLFAEHEQHHREHAEILRKCAPGAVGD